MLQLMRARRASKGPFPFRRASTALLTALAVFAARPAATAAQEKTTAISLQSNVLTPAVPLPESATGKVTIFGLSGKIDDKGNGKVSLALDPRRLCS
ncbi:MAG: hypothetical protein L0Y72_22120 [Gemmataceae bacterium]|nr:hypothetical protein [Gemmataceae bacterium]MCI0741739.1 hypothetical protein [Gemmataceae bacterium]